MGQFKFLGVMRKFVCFLYALYVTPVLFAQIVGVKMDNSNGLFGFVDASEKWVVQPKYVYATWNNKQRIGIVRMQYQVFGMIDENGKIIYPIEKYIHYIRLSSLLNNTKMTNYVQLTDFNRNCGLGDMEGKLLIPCQYSTFSILDTHPQYTYISICNSKQKYGLADAKGNIIIPCEYKGFYVVKSTPEPYIKVTGVNQKVGLATKDGKFLLPCQYDNIVLMTDIGNYIIATNSNGKIGLYSFRGEVIVPEEFNKLDVLSKDYIYTTKYVGEDTFEGVYSFEERKEIIPCIYKHVLFSTDHNCIYLTDVDDRKGIYDTKGNIIIPVGAYDKLVRVGQNIYSISKDSKWGLWGNGKELLSCQYDDVVTFEDDVAKVKKDGVVMLVNNLFAANKEFQIVSNKPVKSKKGDNNIHSNFPAPDSDVDINIPTTSKQAENMFAFIICNENYPDAPVPYSLNDGRMFREYCQKTLGLPEKNINLYEDATYGNMIAAVDKIKSIAEAYDGEASIIFYYAGHGFPDEKKSTAYLLPIDGDIRDITTTGYSLARLYNEFADINLISSFLFLDACFSGTKREDQMLSESRSVAIKVKKESPQGNMIVFSAAQGDETAHQMEEKHHGLFTYYLLKELQASNGDIDMGTLTRNVIKQVKRQSVVINNKMQTPTVITSQTLSNNWQTMKLK